MIGGEGPADPIWMVEPYWVTYAQGLNAYMLFLEHRYYGMSHPTEDASVDNLAYLSTEQALGDLANFVVSMKESLGFEGNKWIAFGGSYPGALAVWFRLKYPHLVHGSVATSAPVEAVINFKEYLEVVRDSLATVSEDCNTQIKEAHQQLDLLLLDQTGWDTITTEFRLCSRLDGKTADDVSNLFSYLAANVEYVVQYNKDNRAFEGVKGTNITVDTICDIMMNGEGDPIDRYAEANSLILDEYGELCLDHTYDAMIKQLQVTSWGDDEAMAGRLWVYQTCTEYGYYQSSDSPNQPFGDKFPVEFFIKQCADIYGPKFDLSLLEAGVKRTNTIFGGRDLNVTRVVFPNGSIDPWHALGITSDLNPDAPAIYINGTAHCANMYPATSEDPLQLMAAREEVYQLITKWLQE
ncbi:putative serine protease K12H4.7 [Homarus americanus]|uniref:putative serine protease K12H4.7 n=1 Tax=Homarus americanus TaxID=6706 RepID=UPI001C48E0A0|nr:putative serine protease K12H4.7 [Homarus americanus]